MHLHAGLEVLRQQVGKVTCQIFLCTHVMVLLRIIQDSVIFWDDRLLFSSLKVRIGDSGSQFFSAWIYNCVTLNEWPSHQIASSCQWSPSASHPGKLCYSAARSARTSQMEQEWARARHNSGETSQLGRGSLTVPAPSAWAAGITWKTTVLTFFQPSALNSYSAFVPRFILLAMFLDLCIVLQSQHWQEPWQEFSHRTGAAWKLRLSSWIGSPGS